MITAFQNFLLSVISFMFRFPKNLFLVDFSTFEQILHCRLKLCQFSEDLFLLNVFCSLDCFMINLSSVLFLKT